MGTAFTQQGGGTNSMYQPPTNSQPWSGAPKPQIQTGPTPQMGAPGGQMNTMFQGGMIAPLAPKPQSNLSNSPGSPQVGFMSIQDILNNMFKGGGF